MEINGENYKVCFSRETTTIVCEGSLRLYGAAAYGDISALLEKAAETKAEIITLDLRKLKFLNSSGINVISKFVIKVRNQKSSKLTVLGAKQFPWQQKSLKNLNRLMPDLELEFE